MRVLIGYDGSECSEAAIVDLCRAGLPADTQAIVLTVADLFPPVPPANAEYSGAAVAEIVRRARQLVDEAVAEARTIANRGAARVKSLFPGWTVSAEACADTPHWALVKRAEVWRADLVVVGSHGRSAVTRVLLGSVSQQVLHHAPCSVRIVHHAEPAASRPDRPLQLLLGIDGSVDSATAASAVGARSWPRNARVLVIGAVDSHSILASLQAGVDGFAESGLPSLDSSIRAVADELAQSGLVAECRLLSGDPKRVLLAEASRVGADCIFLGARGHGRIERLFLGSVSATVAARSHCSVEVVRGGQ